MKVEIIRAPTDADWLDVRNSALRTQRKHTDETPSPALRLKMLCSEHSPIRGLVYRWVWHDQPYWVAMHIRTHSVGISQYISSQRNDVQHLYDRRQAPQDAPVEHECYANAQAILGISRSRTCFNASKETRQSWEMLLDALVDVSPELARLTVPPCVYRNGICPEVFRPCGYNHSRKFVTEAEAYKAIFDSFDKREK